MSTLPLDARQELCRWYYAMRAFEHCKACCEHIIKNEITEDHPLYYSLNVAAVIHYGRPFKRSAGIESLSEIIVPKKYAPAHKTALTMRDKLYAHTDLAGSPVFKIDRSVDILCQRSSNGGVGLSMLEVPIKPEGIRNLMALSAVLIEKTNYHLEKTAKRYATGFPAGFGKYRIGLTAAEPPFSRV